MNTLPTRIRQSLPTVTRGEIACCAGMVVVAIAARLLPHPPNFTPMAAIGLFAGAVCLRPVVAASVIVGAMLISDLFLGFHPLMPVIYGCLLVNLLIGSRFVRSRDGLRFGAASCGRVVAGSLMASVLFFVVTNFAHFVAFYPMTGTGLAACYTAAIPFFQFTLAGDLIYSGVLFGAFAAASLRMPAVRGSVVPVCVGPTIQDFSCKAKA